MEESPGVRVLVAIGGVMGDFLGEAKAYPLDSAFKRAIHRSATRDARLRQSWDQRATSREVKRDFATMPLITMA